MDGLFKDIFNISDEAGFEAKALEVFKHVAKETGIYAKYLEAMKIDPKSIDSINKIPFLPIEFFKTHKVLNGNFFDTVFSSSGTTGDSVSRHYVKDLSIYRESFSKCFEIFYGKPSDYCILALLPSYSERKDSSLIFMVNDLIEKSGNPGSGYYLNNLEELAKKMEENEAQGIKTLLIGVSYALFDLVEQHWFKLNNTIVMETGGMKGRRKEMIREELHEILKKGFGVEAIHSEYGMTELLSQAYSKGNGIYKTPPWLRILIRDVNDPRSVLSYAQTGGINIIDLANIYSCPFIATSDLGKLHEDNTFEVLGRFDNSDIRGCNLMIQ